jgi:hypothetical protein
MAQVPRTTGGRFLLELAGQDCGALRSVEGGGVKGEVVAEPPAGEHYVKKHLAGAAPEPIELTFGLGLAEEVYDWIAACWDGKPSGRDGRIVFTDASLNAWKALEFEEARIRSVTFPALDGASKEAGFLTLRLAPERTRTAKASGPVGGASAGKQKQWLASNFRVEVAGLDTKMVAKVDAFTVELPEPVGLRERRLEEGAGPIDFPGLRVTVSEAGASGFAAWHEEFVVNGLNDDSHEKDGALVLLDSTLKGELGRVELQGLGIYGLSAEKAVAGSEAIAKVVAELYCERMGLAL